MAATKITLGQTNTVSVSANTPYQLALAAGGHTNYFILNMGPGNLFVRYDQPPTVGDPKSTQVPGNLGRFILFPVRGPDGLYAIADQAGTLSILVLPNPLPNTVTIDNNAGGGGQTPWTSDIDAASHNLNNVSTLSSPVNAAITLKSTSYAAFVFLGGSLQLNGNPVQVTGGNFGVNNTTPQFPLDVAGDANVSGALHVRGLPTSPTGLHPGDVWNNAGVMTVV